MNTDTTRATITHWTSSADPDGHVTASYCGGAYVELGFAGHSPTEVLNVWNYETGQPEGTFSRWDHLSVEERIGALICEVLDWIESLHAEGWDDWYEAYVSNA